MTDTAATAKSSRPAELHRLARAIMAAFDKAGYRQVDPPVLQPAEIFLDLLGEEIRRRIYIFFDPAERELCLRPDLTIPTARLYLEESGINARPDKLSYYGRAFRYQPPGSARPDEIIQTGVESYGAEDREAEDARMVALAAAVCRARGLDDFVLRFGDVGLFFDFIGALNISERWRTRLRHSLWQPDEIERLRSAAPGGNDGSGGFSLLKALSRLEEDEARTALEDVLALADITPVGSRTMAEISERLLARAADNREGALPADAVRLIRNYLSVSADCESAFKKISKLAADAGLDLKDSLARFDRRLNLLTAEGIDPATAVFDADFGRNMEYYSGFVFELTIPSLGDRGQIVGGGRYDALMRTLGAPADIPAVGCMIRIENLADALAEGQTP